jgi:hypothetical protein
MPEWLMHIVACAVNTDLNVRAASTCRYYVAEGVRTFSQQTWKQLFPEGGRDKVAKYIDAVVPYYISQSKVTAVHHHTCLLLS